MAGEQRRGWSGSGRAQTAAEVEIRYGAGLLRAESSGWPRYGVVTSPSAFGAARGLLGQEPAGVTYIRSLDVDYLRERADELPDDVELVVGLGGGQVIDAAKVMAVAKDCPLILVPSVLSTGAIIHSYLANFHGRQMMGGRDDWTWADCEYVLVDYELAAAAPVHLHTAGLGDVLCEGLGVAEWRRNRRLGRAGEDGEAAIERLAAYHEEIAARFEATLDSAGGLTNDSLRVIMEALQARDGRRVRHPMAPNADHAFLFALEEANDRSWVHGELAALGALIVVWRCGPQGAPDAEGFARRLDRCLVRRRPSAMGIEREQMRRGLELLEVRLPEERQKSGGAEAPSVLEEEPIRGADFERLWEFLEQA